MRFLFIEPRAPGRHIFSRIQLPRLGNILLGTILKGRGHECRVLVEEARPIDPKELQWADVVGISSTTSTAPAAYAWADAARSAGKPVVMGGPHVTFLPDEALHHADYVVRGEGEEPIQELADVLEGRDGCTLADIQGLSYRQGGTVSHNPARPFLQDLDRLPSPDFSIVENWSPDRVVPVSTSRGCPFACRFCSVIPMFGTRYRFHSVERVLDDFSHYSASTRHIFVCDDNFAADRRRARAICQGLMERNLDVEWSAQVRADCARDPALLDLMADAKCWCVYMGFESINPRTLEAYQKHQTVDDIRRAVDAFRQRHIRVHGMFVFGADQDDRQTIRSTVRFARETGIDTVQFLILTPAPGTPVFEEMDAAGRLITKDWSLYDAHHVVYEPVRFTPDELQQETQQATARFYSLGNAVWSAARLDLFDTGLKLFAWREARRLRRNKTPFLRQLRQQVQRRAAALREVLPRGPNLQVVLPTVGLTEEQRRFVLAFLRGLGLRPLEVPVSAAKIWDQLAGLPDKVNVILTPLLEEAHKQIEGLQRLGWVWTAQVEGQSLLGLPLRPENLYRSCVQIGLAFDRRFGTVRRAYQRALAAAPIL